MKRKPVPSPVPCNAIGQVTAPSTTAPAAPEIALVFAVSDFGLVWGEPELIDVADPRWAGLARAIGS